MRWHCSQSTRQLFHIKSQKKIDILLHVAFTLGDSRMHANMHVWETPIPEAYLLQSNFIIKENLNFLYLYIHMYMTGRLKA